MTLKKALMRGFLGFPLGVFIGNTITILIALFHFDEGVYQPVVSQLSISTGNEITAVIIQYILCGILGFSFAAGSAVFEVEEWSLTKQTVLHFIISTVSMFPIAYLNYWMDHSLGGIISYVVTFVVIYVVIWIIQISLWKKRIKRINEKMRG